MRARNFIQTALLLLVAFTICAAGQVKAYVSQHAVVPRTPQIQAVSGRERLFFEANQGQTDASVRFFSRGNGYSVFLTSGSMVLALRPILENPVQNTPSPSGSVPQPSGVRQLSRAALASRPAARMLEVVLIGANSNPALVGEEPLPTKVNYFIGRDPKHWRTNVTTYARIRYRNIYPGIDLVYYGSHGRIEYDFELAAGADPGKIQFAIKGADAIRLDAEGNLVLSKGSSSLKLNSPGLYQRVGGVRNPIPGTYAVRDAGHVGFVLGNYDKTKPLVIDPVLVYSTYLGGSGDDFSQAIAVDSSGDVYVTGITDSSDFPLASLGSYNPTQFRMFLMKLDPTGSNMLFADYFGGTSGGDESMALALDPSGNPYVAGVTTSTDFPVVNAFQSTLSGSQDAFLAKFSPDGSSILYSTYLGGSGFDIANSVSIDSSGEAVVAGSTQSTDFPTVNAFQSTISPDQFGDFGVYGFLAKFAVNGSSLVYSTYLAGSTLNASSCSGCFPDSEAMGVATDSAGNAYVVGNTNATDFPVTPGAFDTTDPGYPLSSVGFVSKVDSSGTLAYSTYLGGQTSSFLNAIAVDSSGSAYVTGYEAADDNFPIISTSICDPSSSNCNGAIIVKLDPAGANLIYSTFLAPTNEMAGQAIQVDASGNAFIVGSDTQFALTNPIEGYSGNGDLVVVEIDPGATTQLMATFLGGQDWEAAAESLALDASGNVYVTGVTQSSDFPVTQSAFQGVLGGQSDSFIAKIDTGTNAPAVAMAPFSLEFSTESVGATSAPLSSVLRNMGSTPLAISSKSITGDFAESDDCGSMVAAASFCTFTVTFSPTASGVRTGTLTISDDAAGAPHLVSLSGTGSGASSDLAATPVALSFPAAAVGTVSATELVTLTNNGDAAVAVDQIQAIGDFALSENHCAKLAPTASCTVSVTFSPTASGARNGTLRIVTASSESAQMVSLSGAGIDFAPTIANASKVVESGGTASYQLSVRSLGGTFPDSIRFTCSGVPSGSTCTITPSVIIPGSNSSDVSILVSTNAAALSSQTRKAGLLASWMVMPVGVLGLFLFPAANRKKLFRHAGFALIGLSLIALPGCAGGTGSRPQSTPAGTYTLTVTGSAGTVHHSIPLTLIVL